MVLKDNCLQCNKWKKGSNYNPPGGMLNDLASEHDTGLQMDMKKVHGMMYDDFSIPDFSIVYTPKQ